ncbi:MAG: hypothetical protein AAGE52_07160 [Myxococcota bacterium]
MAFRDFLAKQGLRIMQDPRFSRIAQDERVMKLLMQTLELRGQVQDRIDARVDRLAGSLNLATKKELRELKRTLRRMQQELEKNG